MNYDTLDECIGAESSDRYLQFDEASVQLEQIAFVIVPPAAREIPRQMPER